MRVQHQHICNHVQTRTHIQTHIQTHEHTHTHTHTHGRSCFSYCLAGFESSFVNIIPHINDTVDTRQLSTMHTFARMMLRAYFPFFLCARTGRLLCVFISFCGVAASLPTSSIMALSLPPLFLLLPFLPPVSFSNLTLD